MEEIDRMEEEIADRFGKLPPNLERIFKWARIGVLAGKCGIRKVKEGITEYRCAFERKLTRDEIRELVFTVTGLRFSYDGILTVFVPRNSIFTFLEKMQ